MHPVRVVPAYHGDIEPRVYLASGTTVDGMKEEP